MENTTPPNSPLKPNIILITVDQMRFPMHFETLGINSADEFVAQFMPNLHQYIWANGVKFSNYYTAASDCTAARATIQTGLYAYQTYSMLTLTTYKDKGDPGPPQPHLERDFPTIGKLMQQRGYNTPYFGKWHLSYGASELGEYGYDSHTPFEDYPGYAGQGLEVDVTQIANPAASWLSGNWVSQQPFFLSVNFVNPHDKQWFWGGMQGEDFHEVCSQIPAPSVTSPQNFTENIPPENAPEKRYDEDIAIAISNWQPQSDLSLKPATQTLLKEVFQFQMGGVYEADDRVPQNYTPVKSPPDFNYALSPLNTNWYKPIAPKRYWSKALDSYIQCMKLVDDAIGQFMANIPAEVRANSIVVFTSDHGEYGSSHGLQGKGGTVYEEGIRVPLVVYDPTGRFTTAPNLVRNQLCSSVDLLRLIVSLGYDGTKDWMTGPYDQLYGNRLDLLRICADPNEAGRPYVLHTTDEFVSDSYNQDGDPLHVIGLIQADKYGTNKTKLGVYTKWATYSEGQSQATILYPAPATPPNIEFYNQTNLTKVNGEPTEVVSTPNSTEAQGALQNLYGPAISPNLIESELQAELPQAYREAQKRAYKSLQDYMAAVNAISSENQNTDAPGESQQMLAQAWVY